MTDESYGQTLIDDENSTPEEIESDEIGTPPQRRLKLTGVKVQRLAHRVVAQMVRDALEDSEWAGLEGFSPEENDVIKSAVAGLARNHDFKSI